MHTPSRHSALSDSGTLQVRVTRVWPTARDPGKFAAGWKAQPESTLEQILKNLGNLHNRSVSFAGLATLVSGVSDTF
eukprot:1153405-Pelagomonas_calceolata.AAC.2